MLVLELVLVLVLFVGVLLVMIAGFCVIVVIIETRCETFVVASSKTTN